MNNTILKPRYGGGHLSRGRWTRHIVANKDNAKCGVILEWTVTDTPEVQGEVIDCSRCFKTKEAK